MDGAINWVVALKPEAEAVIQRFRLKPRQMGGELFPIYLSPDETIRMVVSGPGRVNAAAATGFLSGSFPDSGAVGWINFGIAGCGGLDYGETFLGGKIKDVLSGKSWYPVATWSRKQDHPRREILTVDTPVSDYLDGQSLVEMEASAFYSTALRSSSSELCHVIKTVSDDPEHPMEDVNREQVLQLCRDALETMDSWLDEFGDLVAAESSRLLDPPGFQSWLEACRFSATQVHQLRRLLQQWNALHGDDKDRVSYPEIPEGNARTVLEVLRKTIWKANEP